MIPVVFKMLIVYFTRKNPNDAIFSLITESNVKTFHGINV